MTTTELDAPASIAELIENALPCPFCGGTEFSMGLWCLDEGEVDSIECKSCYGSAPVSTWNSRPSPWRFPPDMPPPEQRVVFTYRQADGEESPPIVSTYHSTAVDPLQPMVRWCEIPAMEQLEG